MQYNPGWNSSSVNLLHVRAVGPADTLHFIWSSIGAPAVLLVVSGSRNSTLGIDWTRLLSPAPAGAVWIDPPGSVIYSTAVVFTKVPLGTVTVLWEGHPTGGGDVRSSPGLSGSGGCFPSFGSYPGCLCLEMFNQGSSFLVSFVSPVAPQPVDCGTTWWHSQQLPLPFLSPGV